MTQETTTPPVETVAPPPVSNPAETGAVNNPPAPPVKGKGKGKGKQLTVAPPAPPTVKELLDKRLKWTGEIQGHDCSFVGRPQKGKLAEFLRSQEKVKVKETAIEAEERAATAGEMGIVVPRDENGEVKKKSANLTGAEMLAWLISIGKGK